MVKAIEVGFPGGKRVDAIIDGRTIQTNQRAEKVGEGSAPEPFELFLASIATGLRYCINSAALRFIPL